MKPCQLSISSIADESVGHVSVLAWLLHNEHVNIRYVTSVVCSPTCSSVLVYGWSKICNLMYILAEIGRRFKLHWTLKSVSRVFPVMWSHFCTLWIPGVLDLYRFLTNTLSSVQATACLWTGNRSCSNWLLALAGCNRRVYIFLVVAYFYDEI
jgi:hypothetical protein